MDVNITLADPQRTKEALTVMLRYKPFIPGPIFSADLYSALQELLTQVSSQEVVDVVEWKAIPNFENYQINKAGQVRKLKTRELLSPKFHPEYRQEMVTIKDEYEYPIYLAPEFFVAELFGPDSKVGM